MKISEFTVKQLMIAAALARGIAWKRILVDVGVSGAYLSKCQKDPDIILMVEEFKLLKPDDDTKDYKGAGTLILLAGQMVYWFGERINMEKTLNATTQK